MVYLPVNLWAESYVTTLDKTVVQFHLFPSFAPIKTKQDHPLPTPFTLFLMVRSHGVTVKHFPNNSALSCKIAKFYISPSFI